LSRTESMSAHDARAQPHGGADHDGTSYGVLARNLVKSSGIYALASFAAPLVSLVLAPFLTHTLSRTEYGGLAVLTTAIALAAGITQLSLGSAFFRAYNYDYDAPHDRLAVVSTVVVLLALVSIPATLVALVSAPTLAAVLLGSSDYAAAVRLAALVMLAQNLTVPGFAWLRAESRAVTYSVLSVVILLATLFGSLVLVGALHLGIMGVLLAMGAGYAVVMSLTLPIAVVRAGLRLRLDVACNLLLFGIPLVANVITVWILQLSDRYLLGHFGSLTQTAYYDVAYKLGGVGSTLVLTPFQLAWPTALYAIARRGDAHTIFQQVFRWYGFLLLFITYTLALVGIGALHLLFPPSYWAASSIIPIVGVSIMLFGIGQVLGVGINIQRKTWLTAICLAFAALVNVGLNVGFIPIFGIMGASISTFVAYAVFAVSIYVANQRIYPVPFEIGRFAIALLIGVAAFAGCYWLGDALGRFWSWPIRIAGLMVYSVFLVRFAGGHNVLRGRRVQSVVMAASTHVPFVGQALHTMLSTLREESGKPLSEKTICMHVLGPARTDVRVMREAMTLRRVGMSVSIVDVERDRSIPREEDLEGIFVRHIVMPEWYIPTRFKPWFLSKAARLLVQGTLVLMSMRADIYHAHDFEALPACYIVATLCRKRLIYDAHELPLVDPNVTRWPLLCAAARRVLGAMIRNCASVITVSPPIASDLKRRYGGSIPGVVRNIPPYQVITPSGQLRRSLELDHDTRIALYQGNLQADRGLDVLVRAARYLESNIVIVMMGRGILQSQLKALIAREQMQERVMLAPPVPYAELLTWTASADIGLIVNPPWFSPNVRMCLPNKLFEYLMAGVPVLSSRLDAVEELVRTHDVGHIVESLEPEVVGRAINAMCGDAQALAQMRCNALAVSQHQLRWDVEQQRLLEIYQQFCSIRSVSM
jgi:O-antigen/teichoic acid export membrane protein/glycosyltransferase involved in cell wall biosynthesis